jgi:hypothetical protein
MFFFILENGHGLKIVSSTLPLEINTRDERLQHYK